MLCRCKQGDDRWGSNPTQIKFSASGSHAGTPGTTVVDDILGQPDAAPPLFPSLPNSIIPARPKMEGWDGPNPGDVLPSEIRDSPTAWPSDISRLLDDFAISFRRPFVARSHPSCMETSGSREDQRSRRAQDRPEHTTRSKTTCLRRSTWLLTIRNGSTYHGPGSNLCWLGSLSQYDPYPIPRIRPIFVHVNATFPVVPVNPEQPRLCPIRHCPDRSSSVKRGPASGHFQGKPNSLTLAPLRNSARDASSSGQDPRSTLHRS